MRMSPCVLCGITISLFVLFETEFAAAFFFALIFFSLLVSKVRAAQPTTSSFLNCPANAMRVVALPITFSKESFSFSFYVPWRESGSGQTVCDDAEDSFCPGACHSCLEDDTILGISERNRGSHGFKLICDLAGSEFPGSSDEETCGKFCKT